MALILFLSTAPVFAREVSFEVSIDSDRISLGSSTNLNLSFHGTQDVPAPDLPNIDGIKWRYLGPSTRMSIVNGKVTMSITHIYTLIPLKTGTLEVPSFTIQHGGRRYTSAPIRIEVTRGPVGGQRRVTSQSRDDRLEPSEESDASELLRDRIFLIMKADKRRVYVNEMIQVTIKLYVKGLPIRDIQYPEFAHEGLLAGEFEKPIQHRENLSGVVYDVIEFDTQLSAIRPGEFTLGPAGLKCNLITRKSSRRRRPSPFDDDFGGFFDRDIFDDFFDRYERHPLSLDSMDVPVTIMPLPGEGRPDSFDGAIGDYRFYLETDPKELRVGDPVTLKMTVTGMGNFDTVKPPRLDFGDDFKVYDPQVTQEDGKKIFEQVVIPKSEDVDEIPEVAFSFFDTREGEYREVVIGPLPIKVNPVPRGEELRIYEVPEGAGGPSAKREILGRDIIYIKESPGRLRPKGRFLAKSGLLVAVFIIPLIVLITLAVFTLRRNKIESDAGYARRLRAPARARKNLSRTRVLLGSKEPGQFYDSVFKTLQEYLGDKFQLPSAGMTAGVVDDLKVRGIDEELLAKVRECFVSCDTARYAPSSVTKKDMAGTYRLLAGIIDRFERIKI